MDQEKINQKKDFGREVISWQAPEFAEHNRGKWWIFCMTIIAISLIIYGILAESVIFSIVIILLVGVFFLTHNQKPKIVKIALTNTGIIFANRFFPFEDIRTFWIIYNPPEIKTLNLRMNRGVFKEIAIQLGDRDAAEIRAFLSTEIPEWKNRKETLSEILIRVLKL